MDALPTCEVRLTALKPKPLGYPANPRTLGEHLRKRRMDLGLLQKEVAAHLGADVARVHNWEAGHSAPRVSYLGGVIAFLGYDPRTEPAKMGERLVWLRESMGLSQNAAAGRLRIDPGALNRWERGERSPIYSISKSGGC